MMSYLLIALWGIIAIKSTLFWLYLVQLKEYRFKRLADYFHTTSGKRILYNPLVPIFTTALRHPKFTKKAIALLIITVLLEANTTIFSVVYLQNFTLLVLTLITLFPLIFIFFSLILIRPLDIIVRGGILRRATEKMARLKNLTVIGITGSYGKTSTKEFLAAILGTKYKVIKTPEHLNVETGIAQFIISNVNDSYDIFVCEMGGYEKLDIATIVDIIKPKIGVLTGANEQHLALFGSMDNLLSAEGGWELIDKIPTSGFAVINGANKYTREIYKTVECKKLLTTTMPDEMANVWAKNIKVYPDHIEFRMLSKKDSAGAEFRANLLGAQNVENILLAAATAEELGIKLKDMVEAVSKFKPMEKTMTLSQLSSGIYIIDSTYASNPEAVLAHLEYLMSWDGTADSVPHSHSAKAMKDEKATEGYPKKRIKIVVMPCLIELGTASSARHKQIGEKLAAVADLAIITTSEYFSHILLGAKQIIGDKAENKILLIENAGEIVKHIEKIAQKDDVILLEGRSSENIIKAIINKTNE